MKLFVCDGFPIDYYHLVIVVLAESIDEAVEKAHQEGKRLDHTMGKDNLAYIGMSDPKDWIRENMIEIPLNEAYTLWSEHWS